MKSKHKLIRTIFMAILTPLLLGPEIIIIFGGITVFLLPIFPIHGVTLFSTIAIVWWSVVFLQSFFLGRMYCSHICPMTGLFSFVSYVTKNRELLSIEYPAILGTVFNTLWTVAPVYVLIRFIGNLVGFLPIEAVYSELSVLILSFFYLGSLILSKTTGKSEVPHYICPFSPYTKTGMKIGKLIKLPTITFESDSSKCKSCKQCLPQKHCLMNHNVGQLIKENKLDFTECLNCGSCAEFCPHKAVTYKCGN